MERSATTDSVIRMAQPANVVLLPLLLWQGSRLRTTMPRLPEADGARTGLTPGEAPPLRLAILGDSAAAGVGARWQDEALAGQLAAVTAPHLARQISWRLVARSGATARSVHRDLLPSLTDPETAWKPELVVVVVGGNDLTHFRPIPAWRRDMRALIDAIRQEAGPVPIVLAGLPPFFRLPSLPQPLRAVSGLRACAMDDVLRRLARGTDAVWHVPSATLPCEGDDFSPTTDSTWPPEGTAPGRRCSPFPSPKQRRRHAHEPPSNRPRCGKTLPRRGTRVAVQRQTVPDEAHSSAAGRAVMLVMPMSVRWSGSTSPRMMVLARFDGRLQAVDDGVEAGGEAFVAIAGPGVLAEVG
ncbi:MAG: hypothetical protein GEV03_28065 [Streptosporangiales bacterium]|nr:hypothetical protein [Streptosporangiales bacterium]